MLKSLLIANAASCALFGVIFLASPATTAVFLGDLPIWLLRVLGAGLLFNAAHLIYAARQSNPAWALVLYFTIGDVLWVLVTVGIIASGLWITTDAGISVAIAVAVYVGLCGLGQWWAVSNPKPRAAT